MHERAKMKYLDCCIKETLRLYPSVPIVGRNIEKDTYIDGQYIPKGTSIMLLIYYLHRNPLIWNRPEEFMPERFLQARYCRPPSSNLEALNQSCPAAIPGTIFENFCLLWFLHQRRNDALSSLFCENAHFNSRIENCYQAFLNLKTFSQKSHNS